MVVIKLCDVHTAHRTELFLIMVTFIYPPPHSRSQSARGETLIRYMSFVSRPPVELKAPRHRPRTMAVIPRVSAHRPSSTSDTAVFG